MAKKRSLSPLPALAGAQALASDPTNQVRLSASAGTGKTQVLSARVLRLLLNGNKPESILCLTFTKAGAAEMADRIHERLGGWVTMKSALLALDLKNLGEEHGEQAQRIARGLFAKVLDARGSGLRIQTIHGFCQTLLGSFPAEAGLPPGFRPIEGRDEELLFSKALADMVESASREGRLGEIDRLESTAKYLSEEATRAFLKNCARHPDAMYMLPEGDALRVYVRQNLSGGIDDIDAILRTVCDEGGFDRVALLALKSMHAAWVKKDGLPRKDGIKAAEKITLWLGAASEDRPALLDILRQAWRTAEGEWRKAEPDDPKYRDTAEQLDAWIDRLIQLQRAAQIAPIIADALLVGKAYAQAYALAKRAAGVVDFNDLIRSTVALLKKPGIGEWVKFKLDQSVDHILVDEAQDTNVDQWDIVKALSEEFFAGAGAKGDRVRTIFAVGDFKQAIFGFQGTDPREFEKATKHFADAAAAADQTLNELALGLSYRSSQPILSVTDQVLTLLGHEAAGLPHVTLPHESHGKGSGTVTLWPPVAAPPVGEDEPESEGEGGNEQPLVAADRIWASTLAKTVKGWVSGGLRLNNQDRVVEPGDIMILVRSRGALARLIVSRLYEENVEVAGIDRLHLGAPIVVQDLLACIRFVLQPEDDLSLACLLVSPLIGWSQDELYTRCKARHQVSLWQHLGDHKPALLSAILNRTDKMTPYQFLESILSDSVFKGRQNLISRLGEEARDPIDELLNAALAFEEQAAPSLQMFLDWFDRGDVEIKRDPAKPENKVRVMTVHGAKGLQAPVVVLADATSDPDFRKSRDLAWETGEALTIPLFRPRKEQRVGSLQASAEAQDKSEREEHWRLLYVAMTRAEEHLFIGGALRPKQVTNEMSAQCWHVQIDRALQAMDSVVEHGARVVRYSDPRSPKKKGASHADFGPSFDGVLPDWAIRSAPVEAKPPRPLAPSAMEVADDDANPPPSDATRAAARRGILLHKLFERLPALTPEVRAQAGALWLMQAAGVTDPVECDALVTAALAVVESPKFAHIFAPDALAEAPLAGVVNGRVIAGTVDRLLVTDTEVFVVDFKTGMRVPKSAETVSRHHKAQMGAYAAVFTGMFPGRTVRAALLYTSKAVLIELPAAQLAAHKPGFTEDKEALSIGG
jgi:ATP-dependent helicase/nuclease subunit A